MKNKKVLKCVVAVSVVLAIAISICSFMASANMVLIEETQNPDLTYLSLEGRSKPEVWANSGSLEQHDGNYILKSNGWAQWTEKDSMSFAYQKIKFNYSKKATITLETTMTSFDGRQANAGAGLMVRSGTDVGASCVMLHFRPNEIMITYRMKDNAGSTQGRTTTVATSALYPVTFKMELIKGESKVHCYYKSGNGAYQEFGTAPFVYGNSVLAGISSYSQEQDFMSTARFSGFQSKVEAPEGYEEIDPDEPGDTSSTEETPVVLPEDLPPAQDVLLRETFTDGSLFSGEESVTNPIWQSNNKEPNIVTNDEQTNRYLYEYMGADIYYFAGSQKWTDYSASMDLTFTNEYSEGEANEFVLFVRHTDIVQYGHMYYYATLTTFKGQRVLALGKCDSAKTPYDRMKLLEETVIPLDYLSTPGVKHTLTVDAFDNQLTVYWDGEKKISYTDTHYLCKTEGNIGFMTSGAAVQIDNITVTRMVDLLGGDYDNRIGGNWDSPAPKYLETFSDLGMDT